MTEWCSSTTSVRKVRARSSERLRALTFGAARTSAVATDEEIEVMRAPRQGDRFRCCRREPDSARPQILVQPAGPAPAGDDPPKRPPNSCFRSSVLHKTPPIFPPLPEPVP